MGVGVLQVITGDCSTCVITIEALLVVKSGGLPLSVAVT